MKPAAPAGDERQRILVGTSGYSFPDWVGPFYPQGLKNEDMLGFYAEQFPAVEINTSYYRMPDAKLFERMIERTPAGFLFMVKGFKGMTHDPSEWKDGTICEPFREALIPLEQAGRFSGMLLQFPWAFRNTAENRRHLVELRRRLEGLKLFVEFRRDDWNRTAVFDFLRTLDLGWCSVDEPSLPGLLPPDHHVTNGTGYVRFHGRNRDAWWKSGPGADKNRYDYLYSQEELKDWVTKIRNLLSGTDRTFVFFNNCYSGQAADNARIMQELLFGG